jgi:hypothetical protein
MKHYFGGGSFPALFWHKKGVDSRRGKRESSRSPSLSKKMIDCLLSE